MGRPLIGVTARSATNPDTGAAMEGVVLAYLKSLLRAGAAPLIVPRRLPPEALSTIFAKLDGLLLPGGGDIAPARLGGESHPAVYGVDEERDELEFTLARWAAEQSKPILGICRGIQVFNAALGGSLYLDIASQRPGSVRHDTARDLPGAELVPVHARHHEIEEDDVGGRVALQPRERLFAVARDRHAIALVAQDVA